MDFPAVSGQNLAGTTIRLPADFAGGPTIVLAVFALEQRAQLESWVPFVDRLVRAGTVRGRVLAVLPRSMALMKGVIVGAIRQGATAPEQREATVPIFVDVDAFCATLGIVDRGSVNAFFVTPGGAVVEHLAGGYGEAAGRALEACLTRTG